MHPFLKYEPLINHHENVLNENSDSKFEDLLSKTKLRFKLKESDFEILFSFKDGVDAKQLSSQDHEIINKFVNYNHPSRP